MGWGEIEEWEGGELPFRRDVLRTFPDGRLWLLPSASWISVSTVTFIFTLIPVFGLGS